MSLDARAAVRGKVTLLLAFLDGPDPFKKFLGPVDALAQERVDTVLASNSGTEADLVCFAQSSRTLIRSWTSLM